jgi:hypothetical protein
MALSPAVISRIVNSSSENDSETERVPAKIQLGTLYLHHSKDFFYMRNAAKYFEPEEQKMGTKKKLVFHGQEQLTQIVCIGGKWIIALF